MRAFDPMEICPATPSKFMLLRVKSIRTIRVLELWHSGALSTFCIAAELGLNETEVCHIIDDAEGRAAKFEEERAL